MSIWIWLLIAVVSMFVLGPLGPVVTFAVWLVQFAQQRSTSRQ